MNRRNGKWLPLIVLLAATACDQPSAPDRFNILGNWESDGIPGTTAEMTLAEVANNVEGAGAWTDETGAVAYLVRGAFAQNRVTLYFDFSAREDVAFQGRFASANRIVGILVGGGFESAPATFDRTN